ncbi:putative methyltransferase-domain-containing protein [Ampelomyces quisqualis]|uniref:Putative methyltransferase-domain-containing protein n=1 Tax=Ampelomyces quisqualis TaxID=50730 RepID=A0A6A5QGA3_AMPQU|nr:putative methyltransferase-domain-containing protein [Ampelomyces quisqualis]
MSVNFSGPRLPPSSSLVPIRQIVTASEEQITAALRGLQSLYCPLRLPSEFAKPRPKWTHFPAASTPNPVDSGYVSRDEKQNEDDIASSEEVTAALRADPFERAFATRWLTSLISRVEEMGFDEDVTMAIVDDAAFILSTFWDSAKDEEQEALTRKFSFPTASRKSVEVTLNDAPLSGTDHTDVGLQSWGASIVLSSMMCADPARFGLSSEILKARPNIIELGAGTGLVSLTLAKLLPELGVLDSSISATDYHPAVLDNCESNIKSNFQPNLYPHPCVSAALLDWAQPPPHLQSTADLLIASDVIYAPEHAKWLCDCAAHLLKKDGTFWLMVTVRKTGKFEGIPDTVEAAFALDLCPQDSDGLVFKILQKQSVDKRRGIGRGDETGYTLYKIGWA